MGIIRTIAAVLVSSLTLAATADAGLISGFKWGTQVYGTGATVTWSIMPGGISMGAHDPEGDLSVSLDSLFPIGWETEIQAAFDSWSAIADITFIKVPDDGLAFGVGAQGDIRVGAHSMPITAHGLHPNPGNLGAGDVHFNATPNNPWQIGFGLGGPNIRGVAAHEVGHAIGLLHSDVADALMTQGGSLVLGFDAPQPDDIATAQSIYGAPVPEPGSIALVLIGLGLGVLSARRRRRR